VTRANESTAVPEAQTEAPLSAPGPWGRGETYLRPVANTDDLARAIAAVDQTLSEVLVLLYHVVHANQSLLEALHRQGALANGPVRPAEGFVQSLEKGRA